VPARELFGVQLVQQLIHFVGIETWLETIDEGANPKRRRHDGLLGDPETYPQSLVDRSLDVLAAVLNGALEPLGDIGIESQSRPHRGIMRSLYEGVKVHPEELMLISPRCISRPSLLVLPGVELARGDGMR